MANIIADPTDILRRLVFADWLEENGQGPRAVYIRARCIIDGGPPEFGSYVDALKQVKTCGYTPTRVNLSPGFSFYPDNMDLGAMFDVSHDAMECGLPSLAEVKPEGVDEADSARLVGLRLADLVETTTIRGLKPLWNLANHAGSIFATPAAKKLTRLSIGCVNDGNAVSSTVVALMNSPVSRNLVRLGLRTVELGMATAAAIADHPLDRLRILEITGYGRDPSAYARLQAGRWFSRLQRLMMPVPVDGFAPTIFPYLHTFGLDFDADAPLEQLVKNAELPALRRLLIRGGGYAGKKAECLAHLRSGELIELWIHGTNIRGANLKVILAAPWARRLEVLRIHTGLRSATLNSVIDKSPCAKTLRVRSP